MAHPRRTRVLGLAGALTMALTTVTLAGAPAQAADCRAPRGESCVRITNATKQIRSLRENRNGRCLTGIEPGQTREWPGVSFDYWRHHLMLTGYTGRNCEGNTQFNGWNGSWDGPDSRNYYFMTIRNV